MSAPSPQPIKPANLLNPFSLAFTLRSLRPLREVSSASFRLRHAVRCRKIRVRSPLAAGQPRRGPWLRPPNSSGPSGRPAPACRANSITRLCSSRGNRLISSMISTAVMSSDYPSWHSAQVGGWHFTPPPARASQSNRIPSLRVRARGLCRQCARCGHPPTRERSQG